MLSDLIDLARPSQRRLATPKDGPVSRIPLSLVSRTSALPAGAASVEHASSSAAGLPRRTTTRRQSSTLFAAAQTSSSRLTSSLPSPSLVFLWPLALTFRDGTRLRFGSLDLNSFPLWPTLALQHSPGPPSKLRRPGRVGRLRSPSLSRSARTSIFSSSRRDTRHYPALSAACSRSVGGRAAVRHLQPASCSAG